MEVRNSRNMEKSHAFQPPSEAPPPFPPPVTGPPSTFPTQSATVPGVFPTNTNNLLPPSTVNKSPIRMGRTPQQHFCPHCEKNIMTETESKIGGNGIAGGLTMFGIMAACSCCCIFPIMFIFGGTWFVKRRMDDMIEENQKDQKLGSRAWDMKADTLSFGSIGSDDWQKQHQQSVDEMTNLREQNSIKTRQKIEQMMLESQNRTQKYFDDQQAMKDKFYEDAGKIPGYFIGIIVFCVVLSIAISLIPIFRNRDVDHKCPRCKRLVGTYKADFSPI